MAENQASLHRIPATSAHLAEWPESVDVVFIHGLTGDSVSTWTNERARFYWPAVLADHMSANACSVRCWSLDHHAPALKSGAVDHALSVWGMARRVFVSSPPDQGKSRKNVGNEARARLSLRDRASALRSGSMGGPERLGSRPMVFVAHSLGGLLVKAMLDEAWQAGGDDLEFVRNTRAVVFLGTPHSGSGLADFAGALEKGAVSVMQGVGVPAAKLVGEFILGPSDTVKSLSPDEPELYRLEASYRRIASDHGIDTLSLFETAKMQNMVFVVSRSSATPGVGRTVPATGCDHESICKPESVEDPVFREVVQVVLRVATRAQRATRVPVFAREAHEILRTLRFSGRIADLPTMAWEPGGKIDGPRRIEQLVVRQEPNETTSDASKRKDGQVALQERSETTSDWSKRVVPGTSRRLAVEFFRQCEQRIRDRTLAPPPEDIAAAEYSTFDFDTLLLIAWRKQVLTQAFQDLARLIVDQCASVRSSTATPTLTLLYRAVDCMDKVVADELSPSLATELRLVRTALERRAEAARDVDEDGITRTRIDALLARMTQAAG